MQRNSGTGSGIGYGVQAGIHEGRGGLPSDLQQRLEFPGVWGYCGGCVRIILLPDSIPHPRPDGLYVQLPRCIGTPAGVTEAQGEERLHPG